MVLEKLKKTTHTIAQVFSGFTGCTTGGCCGVSLPKADQDALKKLKQRRQKNGGTKTDAP
ncbi:hypothetical protein [Megasphaera cerevisiae]|uniref:hypothetical protein n=1 Tax=Megasphaera cerevisiae TaxID=39029 RepID=UPI0009456ECE|nr:hypothetical protein [Megasphaera cerevisiae]OKY52417.1 hypothetical protein BSR42_12915 [Megasphaera cerevisiae]